MGYLRYESFGNSGLRQQKCKPFICELFGYMEFTCKKFDFEETDNYTLEVNRDMDMDLS